MATYIEPLKVEDRSYPDFEKDVEALPTIHDVEGMECPCCGDKLGWPRGYMDEVYTDEGNFELTERFYCDGCGTWADVTQVYEPTVRRVMVKQDMYIE